MVFGIEGIVIVLLPLVRPHYLKHVGKLRWLGQFRSSIESKGLDLGHNGDHLARQSDVIVPKFLNIFYFGKPLDQEIVESSLLLDGVELIGGYFSDVRQKIYFNQHNDGKLTGVHEYLKRNK